MIRTALLAGLVLVAGCAHRDPLQAVGAQVLGCVAWPSEAPSAPLFAELTLDEQGAHANPPNLMSISASAAVTEPLAQARARLEACGPFPDASALPGDDQGRRHVRLQLDPVAGTVRPSPVEPPPEQVPTPADA